MKSVLAIFIICICCCACKKEEVQKNPRPGVDVPLFDGVSCSNDCYILTGRATIAQSNQPLSNIELNLYYHSGAFTVLWPTPYLCRANTDENGYYSFRFASAQYRNPQGSFKIQGNKEGFKNKLNCDDDNNTLHIFQLDSSLVNTPQVKNFEFYRTARLKVHVQTINSTNFQFLTISYRNEGNGCGDVLNGMQNIDQILEYNVAADIPTHISWNAIVDGVPIERQETITVPYGSTYTFQITM